MNLKSQFTNKKVLFLSVQTFKLEVEIKNKLEELGAQVLYYDERPANNNLIKGLIRLKRNFLQIIINEYYKKILKNTSKLKFDYLFVNKGEIVPIFFLEEFKKTHLNCQFIYYTWDSFANNKHPLSILKYFDRKFTFDSNDALKYNLNFRPLFFLDSFRHVKNSNKLKIKYNLLFIGTAHSDRYKISNKIIDWCNKNSLTSFCYYFMHSKLVFFYKKYFDETFKEFDFKKLSFKSLSVSDILELYKVSNVILDINHPAQSGLTMRTFEAIGAGKKLVTTNREILKYCFFNPNNIFLIDRNDIKMDKKFFESKFEYLDTTTYEKMSIEGWLKCIFFENDPNFWISDIK